jgi:protoheme IX farnesyltransferase
MRDYFQLTKVGIAIFVMLTGLAGYMVGLPLSNDIDLLTPCILLIGLYFISSGSFAINQAQEALQDKAMPRTAGRPVAAGRISKLHAYIIGLLLVVFGFFSLFSINLLSALLAFSTVVLYNGLYTLFWKRRWVFGAVPGAIPGAMPVVIGYAAARSEVFTPSCSYLFLIMFLWQMPHFWSLAIRYKDDYDRGGFPVLPARLGVSRALYHMALYTFSYVGLALSAPLFLHTHLLHLLFVIPIALKVAWEFYQYYKAQAEQGWLKFFLWINLSLILFVSVPVFDRWLFYYIDMRQ